MALNYFIYPWRFFVALVVAFIVALSGFFFGFLIFPLFALVLGKKSVKICRTILYVGFNIARAFMHYGGLMKLETNFAIDRDKLKSGIIVANHPTLIDYVILVTELPNACFIVKEAMWKNPWYAGIVRAVGYIKNNGAMHFLNEVGEGAKKEPIVIFPEGTRSPVKGLHSFYRGAARVAVESDLEIFPLIIECEPRFMGKGKRWYNVPLKRFIYRLSILEVIQPESLRDSESQTKLQLSVKLNNFMSEYYREKLNNA